MSIHDDLVAYWQLAAAQVHCKTRVLSRTVTRHDCKIIPACSLGFPSRVRRE